MSIKIFAKLDAAITLCIRSSITELEIKVKPTRSKPSLT